MGAGEGNGPQYSNNDDLPGGGNCRSNYTGTINVFGSFGPGDVSGTGAARFAFPGSWGGYNPAGKTPAQPVKVRSFV